MSNIMLIGQYQLENLIRNRVTFLYLDLRSEAASGREPNQHLLFSGAQKVEAEKVLDFVRSSGVTTQHPIVLICENGINSVAAAQQLEENSYINVFVVEGGTNALGL